VLSTDRPCALDICNTARSFTHESNTCVIRRWAFLILGCIDLLSCTPPSATLLLTIFGRAQGFGTAPERRPPQNVRGHSAVSMHCNSFARTVERVRQCPDWICSVQSQDAQRIFDDFEFFNLRLFIKE